ncbi:hypothetical protein HYU92_00145 [Candidatus Curtissbacteria bacterium]|nr:hypothetical protein [Candidatus Curtissbacteria bacterium]
MEENDQASMSSANSYLISASLSLHFFWILNIFKEAFPQIKNFLTFYQPVGPLLGLYILSSLVFVLLLIVFKLVKIGDQKKAFWFFVLSCVIFFFLVFPPIFGPIVDLIKG